MPRTDVKLETLKQIAQEQAAQASSPTSTTPTETGPQLKSISTSRTELPIYFYNSRYPFERVVDPVQANDPKKYPRPRAIDFVGGQFIATQQWQVDLLRKKKNVYEADVDSDDRIDPCVECGYRTRSFRDFQNHIKKHLT